ncbi:Protein of unknown function [Gryllus bimaculatus]|nr:Protein of unknown function [Gryllus bimaculatus]
MFLWFVITDPCTTEQVTYAILEDESVASVYGKCKIFLWFLIPERVAALQKTLLPGTWLASSGERANYDERPDLLVPIVRAVRLGQTSAHIFGQWGGVESRTHLYRVKFDLLCALELLLKRAAKIHCCDLWRCVFSLECNQADSRPALGAVSSAALERLISPVVIAGGSALAYCPRPRSRPRRPAGRPPPVFRAVDYRQVPPAPLGRDCAPRGASWALAFKSNNESPVDIRFCLGKRCMP